MPHKYADKRRASLKTSSNKYYQNNKAVAIKKAAIQRDRFRAKWAAHKATLQCTECQESHPATLDFHHVVRHPSNKKVNILIRNCNWNAIMNELKKCIVLCANCHRKHHWEEHKIKHAQTKEHPNTDTE